MTVEEIEAQEMTENPSFTDVFKDALRVESEAEAQAFVAHRTRWAMKVWAADEAEAHVKVLRDVALYLGGYVKEEKERARLAALFGVELPSRGEALDSLLEVKVIPITISEEVAKLLGLLGPEKSESEGHTKH